MSSPVFGHPYKYDGSDDSDIAPTVTKESVDIKKTRSHRSKDSKKSKNTTESKDSKKSKDLTESKDSKKSKDSTESKDSKKSKDSTESKDSKKSKDVYVEESEESEQERSRSRRERRKSEEKRKHMSSKKDLPIEEKHETRVVKDKEAKGVSEKPTSMGGSSGKDEEEETIEDTVSMPYPLTDCESDQKDNSCVKMSMHFITVLQTTLNTEDPEIFRDTMKKTPLPCVLHYLHYLLYLTRDLPEFYEIVLMYNNKYNIASKYFMKALGDTDRTAKVMESLQTVTTSITNRVELNDIDDLLRFTPEFIVMITIQSGNMASHDKMVSDWEVNTKFLKARDLIAAFFGIKKFFSDPDNYVDRRDLIISAICGGSTKVLSRIARKTETEYITEYTLRKTRSLCIPCPEMVEFLNSRYGLEFS